MKRTLKLKTSDSSSGVATLQHPAAPAGHCNGIITYAVTGIPETVTDQQAARLFNLTATVSGHVFAFANLGVGRIVKGEEPA